jgi:hypothetical protein
MASIRSLVAGPEFEDQPVNKNGENIQTASKGGVILN